MTHSAECYLSPADRAELLSWLRESRQTFLELLDDVQDMA